MRREEPLAQMSDMWRERCHKAERERDLARRDYECMNKFREAAEAERDQLREALEDLMNTIDPYDIPAADALDKAITALAATGDEK